MNIIYFLLVSFFWGGSFFAINRSITGFSPFLAAAMRIGFAIVFTLIYIAWKKIKFPQKKYAFQLMLNGAAGVGLPWALLFWGEQHVAPALSSIINATSMIFAAIFAAIILKAPEDKITWNKGLGIAIGFAGIVVIFGPSVGTQSIEEIQGLSAIVVMAIFYGLTIVWLKKIIAHVDNIMALLFESIGGFIFLLPIALSYGHTDYFVTGNPILMPLIAILYLSIFSTTIALILFYKLIRDVGAISATAVTYVSPLVAIALDWLFLDKWVGNQALFGALMIFAALRLINKPVKAIID